MIKPVPGLSEGKHCHIHPLEGGLFFAFHEWKCVVMTAVLFMFVDQENRNPDVVLLSRTLSRFQGLKR